MTLTRRTPLKPGRPLVTRTELKRACFLDRHSRLRPVSDKRKAANQRRRAMVTVLYPERPRCARPGCPRLADDLHEPLSRARGGAIDSPDNQVPLCRPCHDEVTFAPESTLRWAYAIGLLVHSWGGDAA